MDVMSRPQLDFPGSTLRPQSYTASQGSLLPQQLGQAGTQDAAQWILQGQPTSLEPTPSSSRQHMGGIAQQPFETGILQRAHSAFSVLPYPSKEVGPAAEAPSPSYASAEGSPRPAEGRSTAKLKLLKQRQEVCEMRSGP